MSTWLDEESLLRQFNDARRLHRQDYFLETHCARSPGVRAIFDVLNKTESMNLQPPSIRRRVALRQAQAARSGSGVPWDLTLWFDHKYLGSIMLAKIVITFEGNPGSEPLREMYRVETQTGKSFDDKLEMKLSDPVQTGVFWSKESTLEHVAGIIAAQAIALKIQGRDKHAGTREIR